MAVINPLQINAYRRTGIRKAKTDPIDAFWIADLLRINRARPNQIPEAIRLQLRELSRFRFSLVDHIGDLKRKVLSVLDRVFPEYETLFSSVFPKSSRRRQSWVKSAMCIASPSWKSWSLMPASTPPSTKAVSSVPNTPI